MSAAAVFTGQVTAVQVGTYFVGQYYHLLQQQPSIVHQFYNDVSTMTRSEGARTDTAIGMLQIHNLIMSFNYTGIELKWTQSLESWNGGVLVMVSGLVQAKEFIVKRKFAQTFFLAPQENGYFVLSDMFHLIEDEQIHQQAILVQTNYETKIVAPNLIQDPVVAEYMLVEDNSTKNFAAPVPLEQKDTVDKYNVPDPPAQIPNSTEKLDETPIEVPAASYFNNTNSVRDPPSPQLEEATEEPAKHTYASILRVAKGQSGSQSAPLSKTTPVSSEWQNTPQGAPQQSQFASTFGSDNFSSEKMEESAVVEDEGELRSIYVGNLPSSITVSELEQEFKNFGKLKAEGVTIRSRKETGFYYAFIEYDDSTGVQNALKASPLQFNGRSVHVEERKPNNSSSRGGRRGGRGRGGYQSDAPRGRFGIRNFTRGNSGQENINQDYNSRPRVNGYMHRSSRQERGILGNHNQQTNRQNQADA